MLTIFTLSTSLLIILFAIKIIELRNDELLFLENARNSADSHLRSNLRVIRNNTETLYNKSLVVCSGFLSSTRNCLSELLENLANKLRE
jgi:hypothetical protein